MVLPVSIPFKYNTFTESKSNHVFSTQISTPINSFSINSSYEYRDGTKVAAFSFLLLFLPQNGEVDKERPDKSELMRCVFGIVHCINFEQVEARFVVIAKFSLTLAIVNSVRLLLLFWCWMGDLQVLF